MNPEVVVVGSFVQDLAFKTKQLPAAGETRIGTFQTGPGGKGFNQAIAAHRQRVRCAFVGACGEDLFAAAIKEFIRAEGISAHLDTIPGQSTGTAAILVDAAGQNSIVVSLGANDHLSGDFVRSHAGLFKGAPVTLVQAECNLEATEAALELGRRNGGITILNPAPINHSITRAHLAAADIITPNETEFQFLSEVVLGEKVPFDLLSVPAERLHKYAASLGAATVVITLGAQGCFVAHNDERKPHSKVDFRSEDAEPFYMVPAIPVTVTDTTGAGDAFSGGLAAGLVRFPRAFRDAVRYATCVAALSTEKPGTAPSMPTEAEVSARMNGIS